MTGRNVGVINHNNLDAESKAIFYHLVKSEKVSVRSIERESFDILIREKV